MATIQALHIYPLKSAGAITLQHATLAASGLAWDRHWMAVDTHGTFLSQRVQPRLARIVPELTDTQLLLRAPGLPPLALPLTAEGDEARVRIWKHEGTALDLGAAAAGWISEALGQSARLVRASPGSDRAAEARYAGDTPAPLAFPDGFPLLVCNQASLDEINAHLPQPVPMNRFRPNLVLEGLPPFAEDRISVLQAGGVSLRLVKPCTRCVIPSIDQLTGERSTDPTPVLRAMRFDRTLRGVTFGENAVVLHGAGQQLARGSVCAVSYE